MTLSMGPVVEIPDGTTASGSLCPPGSRVRSDDAGQRRSPERSVRYSAACLADALGRPRPTPEQAAVIEAPLASTLVVAGAGSGKTETMAARVVWLVANGWCRPGEVLGLTFTRKAASELGGRISQRLRLLRSLGLTWRPGDATCGDGGAVMEGPASTRRRDGDLAVDEDAEDSDVLTYHGFAGRLLAQYGGWLGVDPDARLLSEASAWQFAHQVVSGWDGPMNHVGIGVAGVTKAVIALSAELAEHLRGEDELDTYLAELHGMVSALPSGTSRSKGLPREVSVLMDGVKARRQIIPLVREYRALKRRHGALDFADQVSQACRLVREVAGISAAARQMYRVVLLDEVQDTSEAQLALLRDLFVTVEAERGTAVPVTAVGDPHQAIYGWRGASATTMQRFSTTFGTDGGEVPVRHLSASWRNDESILEVANTVAGPLRAGSVVPVRRLIPRPGAGVGRIDVARLSSLQAEADHVAAWVSARRAEGVRSAAVLCRRRSQIPLIVASLRRHGLAVDVVGLGGLLTTPEVADVVALLSVAADRDRTDALMRLLTGPVCRLGAADLDGVAAWARLTTVGAGGDGGPPSTVDGKVSAGLRQGQRPWLAGLLDDLPRETWRGPDGESVSGTAVTRLSELARAVDAVRARRADSLVDQELAAEHALGLTIDVDALPGAGPSAGRIALDAFLDVVTEFERTLDAPTMEEFVAWLEVARVQERNLDLPTGPAQPDAVHVMTVHAAKGLEWDAVAVPGLVEGGFPAYTARTRPTATSWQSNAPTDRGWCSRLAELPYDLRGDRDALPRLAWQETSDLPELEAALKRVAQDGGEHLLREERRLMYVAVTRARCDLLLTAPVWAEATTPRVSSRFLEEIRQAILPVPHGTPWADMPNPNNPDEADNPYLGSGLRTCWPLDGTGPKPLCEAAQLVEAFRDPAREGRDHECGPATTRSRNRDGLIRALLAPRPQAGGERSVDGEIRHGEPLSVSEIVFRAANPGGYQERHVRTVPSRPDARARAGQDFHSRVEAYYRQQPSLLDSLPADPRDPEASGAGGSRHQELDSEVSLWWKRFLTSPWAKREPIACELPVDTAIGGSIVRGRIDAVFPNGSGGYVIVDWKTGNGTSRSAETEHALQLAAYRIAFARWAGVAPQDVQAACYYAGSGLTRWFELDSVDVAGLVGGEPHRVAG